VKAFLDMFPDGRSAILDDRAATEIAYVSADNRELPVAFVVDRHLGAVVWFGNPLELSERVLDRVLSGDLDVEAARAIRAARQEVQAAGMRGDLTATLNALGRLQALTPDDPQVYLFRINVLAQTGSEAAIPDVLHDWYAGCRDAPDALLPLVEVAFRQGPPSLRNPALALAAARRAFELSKGEDRLSAAVVLARVYGDIGLPERAVAILESLDPESEMTREAIGELLGFYRRIQALRDNPDAPFNPGR